MKIVVAIDAFKGCLTSVEANQAAAMGIKDYMPDAEVLQIPVSDGGEGWLDAFHNVLGGMIVEVAVYDPLMRSITSKYLVKDDMAVIEIAQASGLSLLSVDERNPLIATSYGTGQLIVDAIRKGCKHIIVGLGGSATSDCGKGMLKAISDILGHGAPVEDIEALDRVSFTIATDVSNPLCGKDGAAHVFAPQKGASPEMVLELDERAKRFAEESAKHFGFNCQYKSGAGAAGGLGYAFMQYLQADCCSGIDLLLDSLDFDILLTDASLIITGEGSADSQTLMGKLPFGILKRAKHSNVPVALIAGKVTHKDALLDAGFSFVDCINPPGISEEDAMRRETALHNIRQTIHVYQDVNRLKTLIG